MSGDDCVADLSDLSRECNEQSHRLTERFDCVVDLSGERNGQISG